MTSVLDNLVAGCHYDGVDFWLVRQGGLPDTPRFGTISAEVDRVAPFTFPAVTVTQIINTGLLDTISRRIAVTGPQLSSLRGKVQIGYRSLTFRGDAAQSGRLISLATVDTLTSHGLIHVIATWRGRP